jgi:hypothetical protein
MWCKLVFKSVLSSDNVTINAENRFTAHCLLEHHSLIKAILLPLSELAKLLINALIRRAHKSMGGTFGGLYNYKFTTPWAEKS